MKHLFIVNPAAGGYDRTQELTSKVAMAFSCREGEFEIYVTTAPMDAPEKIRSAAQSGEELRVYACGGDGTLNECVNGAAGLTNVAVTHFPCGTGNDFVKTFGEEQSRFFELTELLDGEVRPIDVMDCNGRKSVNICSVGVDARIGTQVHEYSALPVIGGKTGYLVSTFVNFVRGVNQHLRVSAGGRVFDEELALVCICNGTWYGGSFNPVPTARVDDGILDILVVKGVSRATFVRVVGKYAKGLFRRYPEYISHLRTQSVDITADEDIVVNIDGEAAFSRDIHLELIPGGVNFIFPANMEYFKNQSIKNKENESKQEISM